MNSYQEQRKEKILEILNPRADEIGMEISNQLLEFLDKEISLAFGRGVKIGKQDKSHSKRRPRKLSAVQVGKIKPATQDIEEVQVEEIQIED